MDPSHELPELSTVYQTLNIKITKDSITLSPANKPHKYCLIFLHGFAMQIQSFLRIFLSPELIGLLNDFKIYIPQAPLRFSTQYNKPVFSWYNLDQESTLHDSVAVIKDVIKKETEILNNDPSKVFIGGFSQGSALSLYIVHTLEEMLGGILVVGGLVSKVAKLPVQERLPPIKIIHGMKDKVKTWEEAKASFGSLLERRNVKVILIEDMKHDMNYEETRKEMYSFLRERTQIVAVQARL